MMVEKRSCHRFTVVNDTYVALKFGVFKVGKIQNINMNGLMFSYIGVQVAENTISGVDLFILHDNFYLPDLPCSVVYSAVGKSRNNSQRYAPYRCGVSFRKMTDTQKIHLEAFLKQHTEYVKFIERR